VQAKRIRAITFDLWDTIIDDDSDEPIRLIKGLRSKPDERHNLVLVAIRRKKNISSKVLAVGYKVANAAFVKCWKEHSITWTVRERLEVLLQGLECSLTSAEFDALASAQSQMEIDIPPKILPGAKEVISSLAQRFKLCIVSDTIITPGDKLRDLLEFHNLKQYFSGFCFSDEVGYAKPHHAMFESATKQLGVDFREMVHVGDRDHNDVKGAQAVGMKAILFTAKRNNDKDNTSANAICQSYADLPKIIKRLDS